MPLRPRDLHIFLLLFAFAVSAVRAQNLPPGATPRGVVYTFMTETAAADPSIDRAAFRERLGGELAGTDPARFRGMIGPGSIVRIDSIPDVEVDAPGFRRAVAWVTVQAGAIRENFYLFCGRDSIWRIEAIRRFPLPTHRKQLRETLAKMDTAAGGYHFLRGDYEHLVLPDDSLASLFRASMADAAAVLGALLEGKLWGRFTIRDVDFTSLDEYRELDDDVERNDLIFYKVDREALERLKRRLGVRRIERDGRYPGVVFLSAAAIDRSSYGYLYSPSPSLLPPLSSGEFVMLRPAAEHWWLYKRVQY